MLLTDTVGFIRKLPHTVIEAFKATLEEVALADLLIHVVDLSHPHYREQMAAVNATIHELNADGSKPSSSSIKSTPSPIPPSSGRRLTITPAAWVSPPSRARGSTASSRN